MDEDISLATFSVYLSLVRVLHRKGLIHVDEVIADYGDVIDFANSEKIEQPDRNAHLQIYRALERFGRSLTATDPP